MPDLFLWFMPSVSYPSVVHLNSTPSRGRETAYGKVVGRIVVLQYGPVRATWAVAAMLGLDSVLDARDLGQSHSERGYTEWCLRNRLARLLGAELRMRSHGHSDLPRDVKPGSRLLRAISREARNHLADLRHQDQRN